jgi:hypothetical protein
MGEDVKEITTAVDELEQTAQAFSKTLYEASAADDGDDIAVDDDAIDADFEVKEDDAPAETGVTEDAPADTGLTEEAPAEKEETVNDE